MLEKREFMGQRKRNHIKKICHKIKIQVRNDARICKNSCILFILFPSSLSSVFQSVSVEDNKVVSTVALKATADVMKNGVTCEVTNEFGSDSKVLPVSLAHG